MVRTQHRIRRRNLQENPETIYVFGDNLARKGLGGQAKEMRGEPNAFGIPTKVRPDTNPGAYFEDSNIEHWTELRRSLDTLMDMARQGRDIVLPADGIGTGRANMEEHAPKMLDFIKRHFEYLLQRYGK